MAESTYPLTAQQDVPDDRDYLYRPSLREIPQTVSPPTVLNVLDQGQEGACTGYALAAAINLLYNRANSTHQVSARMLYEMAKRHDEWEGENYDGSSVRGAIQGWKHMGVCLESQWKSRPNKKGRLTLARAEDARKHTIAAYYRLKPVVSDYHDALNQAGVLVVSAQVHRGWDDPKSEVIKTYKQISGGHAFALVGYSDNGFWVQNSWGTDWGQNGLALWSYEDWIDNVMDGWVFQLALPTPQIFGKRPGASVLMDVSGLTEKKPSVRRKDIAGHFVHVDDGDYKKSGTYWSDPRDIDITAKLLSESSKYDHFLVYVHGGLNSPEDSARRIATMKKTYKDNRIYPFHIMYDTGLVEELKDVILRKGSASRDRVGGIRDWADKMLEWMVRKPGRLVWDEMKSDARRAVATRGGATNALQRIWRKLDEAGKKPKLHLVGHSTGAVLIAHLLNTLKDEKRHITTCSLLAPACTIELFHELYTPVLLKKSSVKLNDLTIYNLSDRLEQEDNVVKVYGKSLLYLVSNAFEHDKEKPLLGMQKSVGQVKVANEALTFVYSDGKRGGRTKSISHGGFDNDPDTMNDILKRILGKKPTAPFTEDILDY